MTDVTEGSARLSTARLQIEPIRPAHARRLIQDLGDPLLYRHMLGTLPPGLRDLTALFREAVDSAAVAPGELRMWAIFARDARRYVGTLEATFLEDGRVEIGYVIFSRFWRRGYALEACRRLLSHLFEDHGAARVLLRVEAANTASVRLAERLGFGVIEPFDEPGDEEVLFYGIDRTRASLLGKLSHAGAAGRL